MNNERQKHIDAILSSLDEVHRAGASPYLYSKIRNRMQAGREMMPRSLAWRMVAALVVVALVNLFTLRHMQSEGTKTEGPASVATEYAISLPQTY